MPGTQTFVNGDATGWITIDLLRGVTLLPLAPPVKKTANQVRLALHTAACRKPSAFCWNKLQKCVRLSKNAWFSPKGAP